MLHRNDGILNGILNEIASSFVLLTPRNDGIFAMTDDINAKSPFGYQTKKGEVGLEFLLLEIPQLSLGMTERARSSGQARG